MHLQRILDTIAEGRTKSLSCLPEEQGLYALADHENVIRYVGITTMTIRRRVERYHVAGDGNSHKYSTVYNAGRLWHDRKNRISDPHDGAIAKRARREITRKHCRAIGFALPSLKKAELEQLEREVLTSLSSLPWNGSRQLPAVDLGPSAIALLSEWPDADLAALERQNERWLRFQKEIQE